MPTSYEDELPTCPFGMGLRTLRDPVLGAQETEFIQSGKQFDQHFFILPNTGISNARIHFTNTLIAQVLVLGTSFTPSKLSY